MERVEALLAETRERTLWLVEPLCDADAERVHDPLMSPIAWDLGHIAAFEDLWVCRAAGLEPLRPELMRVYDAMETPRADRGTLPYLGRADALAYLDAVRERALAVLAAADPECDRMYAGGFVWELLIAHEQQHNETMLQALKLAEPGVYVPRRHAAVEGDAAPAGTVLVDAGPIERSASPRAHPPSPGMVFVDVGPVEVSAPADGFAYDNERPRHRVERSASRSAHPRGGMVLVEAGPVEIGAPGDGFAYDNERPRHRVELPAFAIDRLPVTNGEFARFVEEGGYRRREWWSAEGWAWRVESAVERPLYWTDDGRVRQFERVEALVSDQPVAHVSWYEADAFARAHGRRLPTELEWEKAAAAVRGVAAAMRFPWGDAPPGPAHANLDQTAFEPALAGAHPEGASGYGALGMIGDVWEWTASDFRGYAGFRAYPYEEYSAVFFGPRFKVLRGGSWATRPRVIRNTFRNWDYPRRRQIFAGFRCAADA